MKILHILNTY